MNREIIFRAKRIDNGEWVYGDLITKPIHHECVILENGVINHSVYPESVGQYIGLEDKNGKKIFDGDILAGDFPNLVVGYCKEAAAFGACKYGVFDAVNMYWFHNDIDLFRDFWEIISNIHDTPELINPKTEQP